MAGCRACGWRASRVILRGDARPVNGGGGHASGPTAEARLPQDGGLAGAPVSFLRSKLLPAAIVTLFALALFAVSARIWLPGDMAAPAPLS